MLVRLDTRNKEMINKCSISFCSCTCKVLIKVLFIICSLFYKKIMMQLIELIEKNVFFYITLYIVADLDKLKP